MQSEQSRGRLVQHSELCFRGEQQASLFEERQEAAGRCYTERSVLFIYPPYSRGHRCKNEYDVIWGVIIQFFTVAYDADRQTTVVLS